HHTHPLGDHYQCNAADKSVDRIKRPHSFQWVIGVTVNNKVEHDQNAAADVKGQHQAFYIGGFVKKMIRIRVTHLLNLKVWMKPVHKVAAGTGTAAGTSER